MNVNLWFACLVMLFIDAVSRPALLFVERFALPKIWANDVALERHLRRTRAFRLLGMNLGFLLGALWLQTFEKPDVVVTSYCVRVWNPESRIADASAVAKDPSRITRRMPGYAKSSLEGLTDTPRCNNRYPFVTTSDAIGDPAANTLSTLLMAALIGYIVSIGLTEFGGWKKRAAPATQIPLHARRGGTYVPRFCLATALVAAVMTMSVCARTLLSDFGSLPTLWIARAPGGKAVAALPCVAVLLGATVVVGLIRSRRSGAASAADLVLDDARRTQAIQRVVGASLVSVVPILRKLMELWSTGPHSAHGLLKSATFAFIPIGFFLWWPTWVPRATYVRWLQWVRHFQPAE